MMNWSDCDKDYGSDSSGVNQVDELLEGMMNEIHGKCIDNFLEDVELQPPDDYSMSDMLESKDEYIMDNLEDWEKILENPNAQPPCQFLTTSRPLTATRGLCKHASMGEPRSVAEAHFLMDKTQQMKLELACFCYKHKVQCDRKMAKLKLNPGMKMAAYLNSRLDDDESGDESTSDSSGIAPVHYKSSIRCSLMDNLDSISLSELKKLFCEINTKYACGFLLDTCFKLRMACLSDHVTPSCLKNDLGAVTNHIMLRKRIQELEAKVNKLESSNRPGQLQKSGCCFSSSSSDDDSCWWRRYR